MRRVGDETPLPVHHRTHPSKLAVDRCEKRLQLAWGSRRRQLADIIGLPRVEIIGQAQHGAKRSRDHERGHEHQARHQRGDGQQRSNGHIPRDLGSDVRALRHGKAAPVGACAKQDTDLMALIHVVMQPVPQAPQPAVLGGPARSSAKFDDSDLGFRVDTVHWLALPDRAVQRERTDLNQNGILHLDGFAVGPHIGKRTSYAARNNDDRCESGKQAAAQGCQHLARSTIHPTPRTFLIAVAPNFRRTEWIRNSTALLSTSSLQPSR